MTASAAVTVTERLELAGLDVRADSLLLAPGAIHQLKANNTGT